MTARKVPTTLARVALGGACTVCGCAFEWTAKGGRGRRRDYCHKPACAALAHDVERLTRTIEAFDATGGGAVGRASVETYANTIAGLAAALRAKAPKAAKTPKAQQALFAQPARKRGAR